MTNRNSRSSHEFAHLNLREIARSLLGGGKPHRHYDLYHSPFRPGDDRPSFAVYEDGFKDFGGDGAAGGRIEFIRRLLGVDWREARDFLIKLSGSDGLRTRVLRRTANASPNEPPSAGWQDAARAAAAAAAAYLWSDHPDARRVLAYLRQERRLSDATIRAAGLGFNPAWKQTAWADPQTGKRASLPPGITIPYFCDGVLWAIRVRSITGTFATHLGRREQQIGGKPAPKYLNLAGSRAAGVLYNADQVTAGATLLVVEGEFDALLAWQELAALGVVGVTFGAASTAPAQIPQRWRPTFKAARKVYLALDADAAGQAGAARLSKALPKAQTLPLPAGVKDVTELAQRGDDLRAWFRAGANTRKHRLRVDLPFISDLPLEMLPTHGAMLVKSAMGTGKTRLAARLIERAAHQKQDSPRVLVISHRQALISDLVGRLNREGMSFESYKGLEAIDLRRIQQLGIVVNSLPKLRQPGSATIPVYDIVIIDEIEQVLAHLNGDTFHKQEAVITHAMLKSIVAAAGLVVGMDAHIGEVSETWLGAVRGSPPLLVQNDFTPARGPLTLHDDETTVIAEADRLIEENTGVVVIPTNSRLLVRKLHKRYAARYGQSAVVAISQENSESRPIQDFIAHIDERLPKLRVFIYSPSLGSGVDIQTPVRAVCALFNATPLPASELHQLLGRARHPQETHVYVQLREGHDETNVRAIYNRHLQNAIQTGQVCEFDKHGVAAVNDTQRGFLRLCAMTEAARAQSMNCLRGDFIRLAKGYTISQQEGEHPHLKDEMRQLSIALKADDKAATLAATAIDYQQLERLRSAGEVTPEVRAGHERFKIEDTVGAPLTPDLYDQFRTSEQREALRAFTDLLDEAEPLQQYDREQAADGVPLNKRTHRTTRRLLMKRLIADVFGEAGLESQEELTAGEIEARMHDYLTLHGGDLRRLFGHTAAHSQEPVAILRWMLRRIGVRLDSRQIMRNRERFRVYRVAPGSVARMRDYAALRLRYLAQKRAQREITQNVIEIKESGIEQSPQNVMKPGAGPGEATGPPGALEDLMRSLQRPLQYP